MRSPRIFLKKVILKKKQVKIFPIPTLGGERLLDERNVFLRAKKIWNVENQMVVRPQGASWCFCIKYLDDVAATEDDDRKTCIGAAPRNICSKIP